MANGRSLKTHQKFSNSLTIAAVNGGESKVLPKKVLLIAIVLPKLTLLEKMFQFILIVPTKGTNN
jgi:hypothetical protein